jgi:thioredoxin-related protein
MKLLITLFITAFSITAFAVTGQPWLTDFTLAKKEAAIHHKLILVNFSGSDWCGPCIRMKNEIFKAEAFEKYADDNLVLINADFPRAKKNQLSKDQIKKNELLAEKYNKDGKFPLTVLIDSEGKVLKKWEGFPNETSVKFIGEINSIVHASK